MPPRDDRRPADEGNQADSAGKVRVYSVDELTGETRAKRLRYQGASDLLRGAVAVCVGFLFMQMPPWLLSSTPGSVSNSARMVVEQVCFLLAGTVMGLLNPERVWRWGVFSFLALPLVDLVHLTAVAPDRPVFAMDLLPYIVSRGGFYGARALPSIIGSYLGAYLRKG